MQHKKLIFMFFMLLWMLVIFLFSNQSANISETNSDNVASKVIDTVSVITNKKVTESKKKEIIKDTRVFVRKTAHFTLYFILNFFVYFTLKTFGVRKSILYSILICFLFACTDEIHQLFIAQRAGRVFDVFIDTLGSSISSLCIFGVKSVKEKKIWYNK